MQFHTYVDWTLEDVPRPFYVGKGNEDRVRNPERNTKHRYVRKHYGYHREIVFVSNNERECLTKEIELIAEHHTYSHDPYASDVACNFTLGGEGVAGLRHSEESRRKISLALAGKTLSPEHREKLAEANRGKPFAEERCRNISRAKTGVPNPKLRREVNPQRGQKISDSLQGRQLSEEHKKSVARALKRYMTSRGEWHPSDETRLKMSRAQKRARQRRQVLVDPKHPDALPKACIHCGELFFPKGFTPCQIQRHKVKRFCTRSCVMRYENAKRD
jgi:hypothetical protein